MDDRKLIALKEYFIAAIPLPSIRMWFAVPGGLITGKPISLSDYYKLLSKGLVNEIENSGPDEPDQFFYLKDVTLDFGAAKEHPKTAVLDGLQVAAWGYIEANPNTVSP